MTFRVFIHNPSNIQSSLPPLSRANLGLETIEHVISLNIRDTYQLDLLLLGSDAIFMKGNNFNIPISCVVVVHTPIIPFALQMPPICTPWKLDG